MSSASPAIVSRLLKCALNNFYVCHNTSFESSGLHSLTSISLDIQEATFPKTSRVAVHIAERDYDLRRIEWCHTSLCSVECLRLSLVFSGSALLSTSLLSSSHHACLSVVSLCQSLRSLLGSAWSYSRAPRRWPSRRSWGSSLL